MEIAKTIQAIHDLCANFLDLEAEPVEKEVLEEYVKSKGAIPQPTIEEFINLIFDETEESLLSMPKENFLRKYNYLLKLIQEENSEEEIEVRNISLDKNDKKETKIKNRSIIGKSREMYHSEILQQKEKSSVENNHIDNSMDPNELFHDINFNDSEMQHSNSLKSDNNNQFSVVRPTNTFNFNNDMEINLEDKLKMNLRNKPPRNFIDIGNLVNAGTENNLRVNSNNLLNPPQYINYQHNININVNNYGNLNMNPLAGSINFSRNSINQKLQEVYLEINRTNEKSANKNYSRKPTIKMEDLLTDKKDTLVSASNKKDQYFMDFCKSVNFSNRANPNLKNISERLLNLNKRESGSLSNANTLINSQNSNKGINKGIKMNVPNFKEKVMNYKFFTLEKLLHKNNDTNYSPPTNSNPLIKPSSGSTLNFDSLEEQLHSLYKRNQSLKPSAANNDQTKPKRLIIDKLSRFQEEEINDNILPVCSDRCESQEDPVVTNENGNDDN